MKIDLKTFWDLNQPLKVSSRPTRRATHKVPNIATLNTDRASNH